MNSTIGSIPASASLAITSRAKAMAKDGREIYNFAAGEPDFDTPQHIKDAAIAALNSGETKYSPVSGIAELRSLIAEKFARDNGLNYQPEQIVVSNGGKHSLFNIIMALCEPGDEFVIPQPYWLSYPEMVKIAGGVPVFLDCPEDRDFKMSPDGLRDVLSARTRAVVVNSPSNPTGCVYSRDELESLAEVLHGTDIYVIADEMYEKIIYDGSKHVSIGTLSDDLFARTLTANGVSKAYSMTGWRLGYFGGPIDVVRAVSALQSHSTSGANTFAQHGAVAALHSAPEITSEMVSAFAERRALLYERLTGIEGITCVKPMGAFYMLPNVSSYGLGSVEFAGRLLVEAGVALVPGTPFGAEGHVRLSYACSLETIENGTGALRRFIESL